MQQTNWQFNAIFSAIVLLTMLVSAVFLIFPEFDIYLSSLFATADGNFPLESNFILGQLRWFYMVEVAILCIVPSFMLFFARAKSDFVRLPAQFWDWIIASFVLGPLILVNLIFKSNWGRPRPAQIEEFGGPWEFVPPYFISDQCHLNCSFVSGEGSAIATAGVLLGICSWTIFSRHRVAAISFLTIFTTFGIALRFVKGRHFMSDSLLALLFCTTIILLLYKILKINQLREKITLQNLKHDFYLLVNFRKK